MWMVAVVLQLTLMSTISAKEDDTNPGTEADSAHLEMYPYCGLKSGKPPNVTNVNDTMRIANPDVTITSENRILPWIVHVKNTCKVTMSIAIG